MATVVAEKDDSWQDLMRTYFQEADYHTLGAILRNWSIRGTENQNGTWIDWAKVPDDCQNEVERYVHTVVKSRREQKEWEERVRMEVAEKKNHWNPSANMSQDKSQNDDQSYTYEEKTEMGEKSQQNSQQSWVNRKGVPRNVTTIDEPTASQWVLDRVPYQLKDTAPNQPKWKKIGNLEGYVVYDEGLIWQEEEDDPSILQQNSIWRQREEAWWKISPRENLNSNDSKERVLRAQEWMKNRRKFSLHSQKILKYVRDFVRSQGIRRHFLICPESWEGGQWAEEGEEAEMEEPTAPVLEDDDGEDEPRLWADDEEEDVWAQNPFQNRQTEEMEKKTDKKKKRKTGGGRKKKGVSEEIFASGTSVQKK